MHNNYYFLRQLSAELEDTLKSIVASECFSQNKDELIIRFERKTKSFYIKASLLPRFCCLSFPVDFNRAKKNSVDLFPEIIGLRVDGVRQFANERSFSLVIDNEYQVLFKMHGNRANLVLFHQDRAVSLFKNHLQADLKIRLNDLDKKIDWSKEAFMENLGNLQQHYFTFGNVLRDYLGSENFELLPAEEKWNALQSLLERLDKPDFLITELNGQPILSLVPFGMIQARFKNATEAVNEFFMRYSVQAALLAEKHTALAKLRAQLKNGEAYIIKTSKKLKEIEADDHYKTWADLLMANLHRLTPGLEKIVLPDFHHENKPVEIRLKKELTAQKNAEVYYRKSKNHFIEVKKLKEAVERKRLETGEVKKQLDEIEKTSDLKELREKAGKFGLNTPASKTGTALPYFEFEYRGFKIWVGKNAKHNDKLTQRHSYKEDLWLHAKDVAGSHVLVKHQAGKKFPKEVIERAAQLAAYHSRRKNETLCPVVVTPRKFVRKRKGDPPGTVVIEKEEIILVEPKG